MSKNLRNKKLFDSLTKFDDELISSVITTYNFDSSYFENVLLPKMLKVRQDQFEDEKIVNIDLVNKLQQTDFFILADGKANINQRKNLFGYKLIPVFETVQHSKIFAFQFKDSFRVVIGSANLTQDGIHRNREVYIEFCFDNKSEHWDVFNDVVSFLKSMSEANGGHLDSLLQSWNDSSIYIRSSSKIVENNKNVSFLGVGPNVGQIKLDKVLKKYLKANDLNTQSEVRVDAIYISSAFFEQDQSDSQNFNRSLLYKEWSNLKGAQSQLPEVYIYTPSNHDNLITPFPSNAYAGVKNSIRDKLFVYKNPQDVKVGKDEIRRFPHSKCYSVVNFKNYTLNILGSSNFSPSAFGVRGKGKSNWEANVVMFNDFYDKYTLKSLYPKDLTFDHDVFENPEYTEFETNENPSGSDEAIVYIVNCIYEKGQIEIECIRDIAKLHFIIANEKLDISWSDNKGKALCKELSDYCLEVRDSNMNLVQIIPIDIKDKDFDPFEVEINQKDLVSWIESRYLYRGELPLSALLERLKSKGKAKGATDLESISTDEYLLYRVKAFNSLISCIQGRLEELNNYPKRIRYHLLGKFGLVHCIDEYLELVDSNELGIFSVYQAVELVSTVLSSLSFSPNSEVKEIMDEFWQVSFSKINDAKFNTIARKQISQYIRSLKKFKNDIDSYEVAI